MRVRSVLSTTTLSLTSPTWNLNWICGPPPPPASAMVELDTGELNPRPPLERWVS